MITIYAFVNCCEYLDYKILFRWYINPYPYKWIQNDHTFHQHLNAQLAITIILQKLNLLNFIEHQTSESMWIHFNFVRHWFILVHAKLFIFFFWWGVDKMYDYSSKLKTCEKWEIKETPLATGYLSAPY